MGSSNSSRRLEVTMEGCPLLDTDELTSKAKTEYTGISSVYTSWAETCSNFLIENDQLMKARADFFNALQIKQLGQPHTELAVKVLVYSLLRDDRFTLKFQVADPYIRLADKRTHELYDAWKAFLKAVVSFSQESKNFFQALFNSLNSAKGENLERTRKLIAAEKIDAIYAVRLLKPLYINNDKVTEVKKKFDRADRFIKQAEACFAQIVNTYGDEEALQAFREDAQEYGRLPQKQFVKSCRKAAFF